jgi:CubicO group peptidase (beta-lactamase class C family)
MSKTFTAVLAMQQVERGRLGLDTDINRSLTRWRLPGDERYPPGTVTLRQLLSHTAGLGVHGFMGYPPGAPLPTLPEILDGKPPANTDPVRIEAKPGTNFSYSGGGYMIIQLAIEDTTRTSFADLAARNIFGPLGMSRSSFAQPPTPAILSNAATGHQGGQPFAAKFTVLPELAAAGLWTTPSDLARFLIDIRAASLGETGHLVTPQTAAEMLKPGMGKWGLGFAFFGEKPNQRFGHYGGNWGFLSEMFIDPKTGDGIAIMTNGEQGLTLADEIVRSAADHYGWPGLQSRTLADTLRSVPVFLRGSMNDWSTATRFQSEASGVWQADIALKPGNYEFKIGSEDWTLGFGIEGDVSLTGATKDQVLSTDGGNIPLKIAKPGTYRFTFHADETGLATLSIAGSPGWDMPRTAFPKGK